jgi:CBS domain-containing protein
VQEFTDFLAKQPPFNSLSTTELERISSEIEVEYFARDTVIVSAGSVPLDHLYIVRTGAVEVLDKGNVVDQLGSGDAFGHISVLTGLPPQYSVRASEDTLCYRLPDPRKLVEDPTALEFSHFGTLITRHRLTASVLMSDAQSNVTRYMRNILWVSANESIRDTAKKMNDSEQSFALVESKDGAGLVTDRDFRSKVGRGEFSIDSPVGLMMSHPLITVSKTATLASAFLLMVERGVHHLVVVDEFEKPLGVVRAMDLSSVQLRNPLLIRAAIESAQSIDELSSASLLLKPSLVELHDNGIPSLHIAGLMSAIVGAILTRLLTLSSSPNEPVPYSWLILGSIARGEPLPASDVDTAIVWADQKGDPDPSEQIRNNAKHILGLMEKCGLQRCPNGANADNGLFSRSRSAWIEVSSGWLTDPTRVGALLLSSIVADNQPITQPTLGRTIMENIRETTRSREYLADALRFAVAKRPPVGFVREFVVEHSGENRGGLNLKEGGLTPIASLARWLAIAQGDVRGGTIERLRRAHNAGILLGEESEILVAAFTDIHQLVFDEEIAAIRAGRSPTTWISPESLDSLTRRHLRETFRAISSIQGTMENNWSMRLP